MPASRCTSRTFYGDNNHHIAESAFKALARALRDAVEIDPRAKDRHPLDQGHALIGRGLLPAGEQRDRVKTAIEASRPSASQPMKMPWLGARGFVGYRASSSGSSFVVSPMASAPPVPEASNCAWICSKANP